VRITDPISTISERVRHGGVNVLATVVGVTIDVVKTVNAHEEALTVETTRELRIGHVVVAEDRASRQILGGTKVGRDRLGEIDVQVVAEEEGVLLSLSLHDGAIHELALIHEDTSDIVVLVGSNLATSLPFTVGIGAVDLSVKSARASEVALVLANDSRIFDALGNNSAINTRQSQALKAVVRASGIERNVGLATVLRVKIAILPANLALEDAITAGLKVSNITVAVGLEDGGLNVHRVSVGNEIPTIDSRAERSREVEEESGGRIRARSVVHVETEVIAEVDERLRALLRVGAVATTSVGETKLAPAASVLATVAWVGVAILVVVETTIRASQANLTIRAGTGLSSVVATLARDEGEAANVQVLLLSLARVLRPVRAIEGSRSSAANGATSAGSSVVEGNLATVLPVSVLIGAEKRVAGHGALIIGATLVASGSRGSTRLLAGDQVNSTREVFLAVDARARGVANRRFATVARVTIAILEAVDASELASTNRASGNNLLTTTAVNGLRVINVETTIKVLAVELSGLKRVTDVELGTSVAKSSLATVGGLLESPVPADLGVHIGASAQLDLATVTRITVAVFVTELALIIASTRAV